MDGTPPLAELRVVASASLFLVSGMYRRRGGGALQFDGERPGPQWRAHGYFWRFLRVIAPDGLRRVRLFKRRWFNPESKRTCHSRPPDDFGRVSVCGLSFLLLLHGWLLGSEGRRPQDEVMAELDCSVSRRSRQRWLRRALPHALQIQQDCRRAVIDRCEPRPVEKLFPRGLSPPEQVLKRNWQDPQAVTILCRGLATLFVGAVELAVPPAILLAEARGRSAGPENSKWI